MSANGPDELPSRGVRGFVVSYLAAFLVCGFLGLELWPLTGWRLFSELRTDRQIAWRATAVGEEGEKQIRFEDLPHAYRNFALVMRTLSERPRAEQEAACRAWLDAVRRGRPDASTVRVYRIDWYLSYRHGSKNGPPPSSTLLLACSQEATDAAG